MDDQPVGNPKYPMYHAWPTLYTLTDLTDGIGFFLSFLQQGNVHLGRLVNTRQGFVWLARGFWSTQESNRDFIDN